MILTLHINGSYIIEIAYRFCRYVGGYDRATLKVIGNWVLPVYVMVRNVLLHAHT